MQDKKNYAEILTLHNIRPSVQRLKILEFIAEHPCHPTVDVIYNSLHLDIMTLSKTTVYNTVKTFVDTGLLREIAIENNEIRYEYNLEDHGHFKCKACGNVYDFTINTSSFKFKGLENFKITDKNLYFKGICKECLQKQKITK